MPTKQNDYKKLIKNIFSKEPFHQEINIKFSVRLETLIGVSLLLSFSIYYYLKH